MLAPGDTLVMREAGGGGFGDPKDRDPLRLREDIRNGLVSPEGAVRDYAAPARRLIE